MRRSIGWFVAAIAACASCSGSTASPRATGSAATGSGEATSASGLPVGHDIAALQNNVGPSDVLPDLFGMAPKTADPAIVELASKARAEIAQALDGPLDLPSIPAYGGLVRRGFNGADFLFLDLFILGTVIPSERGAEALSGFSQQVAHSGGLDAPDGPEHAQQQDEAQLDTTNKAGTISGTFTTSIGVDTQHSLVKVDLQRTMTGSLTKDNNASPIGAKIHNVESMDFCPDAAGVVPADLETTVSITGGPTTLKFQVVGHFLGYVSDNADLTNITGSANVTGLTMANGNSQDPYTIDITGLNFPVGGNGVELPDAGTWDSQSQVSPADVQAKVAVVALDLQNALEKAYGQAQSLWQNSSCVTAQIPDFDTYGKTTPPSDVDTVKEVAAGSTTKFTAQVHHRFEHDNPSLAVTQTLDKDVKLEPPKFSSTPGQSTYEAPNEVAQSNLGTFESRSRRGRSVLKVRFYTEEKPPTIGITGTMTTTAGPATETGPITMPPIQFTDQSSREGGGTDYSVDAPVSGNFTLAIAGISIPCTDYATETGTVHLTAHSESRGDHDRVWVIVPDPGKSHFDATVTCQITVARQFSQGAGMTAKFIAALGTIEIPVDPGTTNFDKQRSLPLGSSDHAVAQVTLVAPPP